MKNLEAIIEFDEDIDKVDQVMLKSRLRRIRREYSDNTEITKFINECFESLKESIEQFLDKSSYLIS